MSQFSTTSAEHNAISEPLRKAVLGHVAEAGRAMKARGADENSIEQMRRVYRDIMSHKSKWAVQGALERTKHFTRGNDASITAALRLVKGDM